MTGRIHFAVFVAVIIGVVTLVTPVRSASADNAPKRPAATDANWPFFALCMDTRDTKHRTLAQQAQMLKELGYAGAGHVGLKKLDARIKTLDTAGLTLFQLYVSVDVSPKARQACPPELKDILPLLEGRPTILALMVKGGKPSDTSLDERVVKLLREIADQAKPCGLKVALYPHVGMLVEKFGDAIRVAKKAGRANVGVMFNLCHYLKAGGDVRQIRPLLEKAVPLLIGVTINGSPSAADVRAGKGKWIAPLDECAFNVAGLLRDLQAAGYTGPVGLQCYGIGGDAAEHLARSMIAWKKLLADLRARH